MNENFFKDIMIQNYQTDNFYDPTKLFIILGLIEDNSLKQRYSYYEIAQQVYRYYISNYQLAEHSINIVIRNLRRYGVEDIVPYVLEVVKQWIRESKYGSLRMTKDSLLLNVDSYDNEAAELTETICNTLFLKYYKKKIVPIDDYKEIRNLDDHSAELFGKSGIKNLIFEDLQYCPLCENVIYDELYATHILFNEESNMSASIVDKNNLLLMCKEEFVDYSNKLFWFDEFGRVINNGSKIVNNRMRLSQKLLNKERKFYIKEHLKNHTIIHP